MKKIFTNSLLSVAAIIAMSGAAKGTVKGVEKGAKKAVEMLEGK